MSRKVRDVSALKNTAVGAVFAALILLLLEAGARVAATVGNDLRRSRAEGAGVGFMPSEEFGWVRRPNFRGIAAETHLREFDAAGFSVLDTAQVAHADFPRVVCIGDSNTFGLDVASSESFPEVADRLLPRADVINLGVPGYSSFQGLLVAREYLPRLQPAVVAVSFNFNDRRWVPDAGQEDGPKRFRAICQSDPDRMLNRLRRGLEYSYLYRGARRAWQLASGHAPGGPTLRVRLDEVAPRVELEDYRENLREIARLAHEQGARILFIVLRDRPSQSKPLGTAVSLIARDRPREAIPILRSLHAEQQYYEDLAALYLARAFRAIDRSEAADALLWRETPALLLDGRHPIRVDTDYNRVMREVAAEVGATCIEAGDALDAHPEVFTDTCHFDSRGHDLVGHLLAAEVAAILDRNGASDPALCPGSAECSPLSRQPEQRAQHQAGEQAGHDGKVKAELFPAHVNVAGQPTQPAAAPPRPEEQPNQDRGQPEDDQ